MDTVRPVHVAVDCATKTETSRPLSDAEVQAQQQRDTAEAAAQTARAKADADLKTAVAAHTDPVVKALAARLFGGA